MSEINRYVITSVQNDTRANQVFFDTLLSFCKRKKAELILIPTKYVGSQYDEPKWHEDFEPYIVNYERKIGKNIKVLGDLYLLPTLENPIAGFDVVSKGKTVIIGHNQLQMKHLSTSNRNCPIMLTSTGSLTFSNVNTTTKVGKKAVFNHSHSAIYISIENENKVNEQFHSRVLNFDGKGFYDIDGYYEGTKYRKSSKIDALVTGDEHAIEIDETVLEVTYGKKGIVDIMKPSLIIRHDVLSANAISHHNKNQVNLLNKMFKNKQLNIENELRHTCEHIIRTTPKGSETLIVASNHNEHLDKWLEDPDSNRDMENAKLYHWFMYQKLSDVNGGMGAFEMYMKKNYPESANVVKFLNRDDPWLVHDIEIHNHGDKSENGGRNGKTFFPKHTSKVIHGHYHTASINKGSYCVGTSSKMKLSYTSGLSNWTHTHCIVYPNGKRQLINIINGKWFV